MDLGRLLRPRSVAVVGATDRPGSYGEQTLRNLAACAFSGTVWGVHPTRTEVLGRPCVPSVEDLPEAVDAVVIAIPASGVPDVVAAAAARGCGSAVVFAAGFAEAGAGDLQERLRAAAGELPVLGPNCDGLINFHGGAALWGDALVPRPAGRVALVSQSGNVAVNALAVGRGLRFHTVASVGNQAVLDAAALLGALVEEEGVGSVALFLESDGDGDGTGLGAGARGGARDRHRGAEGRRERGWRHRGGGAYGLARRRPARVPGAGGGGGWRVGGRRARPARAGEGDGRARLAGGPPGRRARDAHLLGRRLRAGRGRGGALRAARCRRLPRTRCARSSRSSRHAATVGNPLDYTAMIWGERERLAAIVRTVAGDPSIDQLLLFYDEPPGLVGGVKESWDAVRDGLADGATGAAAPALVASTLPELLQDESAVAYLERGIAAVAGLRTALACAAALQRPLGSPERLRAIAAAAAGGGGAMLRVASDAAGPGAWLSEADAKALLRGAGIAVPAGEVVTDADEAIRAAAALGVPVAIKATSASMQHKSEAGALVLGVSGADAVRAAYEQVAAAGGPGAAVLVEAMARTRRRGRRRRPARRGRPGARRRSRRRLDRAARRRRHHPAAGVAGTGRGSAPQSCAAQACSPAPAAAPRSTSRPLASLASAAGALLLAERLTLLELNPVIATATGAVAVDAVARR